MQKLLLLLLLLLPLAIAACVDRDAVPANSAGTPRVETYPSAPWSPSSSMALPTTGDSAQRSTLPGRGEGERESPAPPSATPVESSDDDMPDGSIDVPETSDVERNRAGSSDVAPDDDTPRVPRFDPTRNPAVIDESGAPGFGGRVSSPESLGDGELRADDNDGSIEPDELPMLPVDVVDAGPAMIP